MAIYMIEALKRHICDLEGYILEKKHEFKFAGPKKQEDLKLKINRFKQSIKEDAETICILEDKVNYNYEAIFWDTGKYRTFLLECSKFQLNYCASYYESKMKLGDNSKSKENMLIYELFKMLEMSI